MKTENYKRAYNIENSDIWTDLAVALGNGSGDPLPLRDVASGKSK